MNDNGRFKIGSTPWNKGLKGFRAGEKRKPVSEETRQKMSLARLGKSPVNKGKSTKPFCLSCNKRLINAKYKFCIKCYRGEYHHNWKGGISKNVHSVREPKYRQWRDAVFQRDVYTCQHCGASGVYIEAHHIKGWAKYPDFRYDIDNGLTLCLCCHRQTDNYRGRANSD